MQASQPVTTFAASYSEYAQDSESEQLSQITSAYSKLDLTNVLYKIAKVF